MSFLKKILYVIDWISLICMGAGFFLFIGVIGGIDYRAVRGLPVTTGAWIAFFVSLSMFLGGIIYISIRVKDR